MAAGKGFTGRKVTLTIGGVGSIPIMTKGLAMSNGAVDVTSDTSNGWTTILAEAGVKSVKLSFSGVVQDLSLLMSVVQNVSQLYTCVLIYPDGSTVTGDFQFGEYSDGGDTGDKYTFDGALASSGAVVFVAGV